MSFHQHFPKTPPFPNSAPSASTPFSLFQKSTERTTSTNHPAFGGAACPPLEERPRRTQPRNGATRASHLQKSAVFRLNCRAGTVADLPAFPGGKVSFLNHSRPTKNPRFPPPTKNQAQSTNPHHSPQPPQGGEGATPQKPSVTPAPSASTAPSSRRNAHQQPSRF